MSNDLGLTNIPVYYPQPPPNAATSIDIQTSTMRHLLSGEATFIALHESINELVGLAPDNHDVLIQAFDIAVTNVLLIEPHTLRFSGFDQNGNETFVVAHFSQVVARVIYRPIEEERSRVITGFAVYDHDAEEPDE